MKPLAASRSQSIAHLVARVGGWVVAVAVFVAAATAGSPSAAMAVDWSITASAGTGGSISPSGAVAVLEGTDQAFTIAADACFAISDVVVDGSSVGVVSEFTFTNVILDHTISATFSSTAQPTSNALTVSPSPSVCQQSITLTATLTPPSATGTVEFLDGAISLGTASVSGGTANLILPTGLPAQIYALHAAFTPTGCFVASTSPDQAHTVGKANSSLAVTSDVNPSAWPTAVTFTATVSSPLAGGTVTFKDSLATLGSAPVIGGVATLVKSNLLPGLHTRITATYSGDACYKNSAAPAYEQAVSRGLTSVSMVSNINPSTFIQTIQLKATVVPAGTTGRVTFSDGGTLMGTAAVNAVTGLATLNVSNLLPGTHALTVTYPGDVHFASSASGAYNQVVDPVPTTTSLAISPAAAVCQQPVTLTATVSPIDATGTVSFVDGVNPLGTAPVSGGIATLVVSTLNVATHTIGASYGGDTFNGGSAATNKTIVISKAPLTLALTSGPSPSIWAQTVTLTATASSALASGTVTFKDSLTTIGTAPLVGGVATLLKSNFQPGNHTALTANVPAGACYLAATAPATGQVVNRASTTVSMSTNINPSTFAQTVKLTATVSPVGGVGRVTFYDGVNVMGTATVSALTGLATLNTSNLAPGSHNLTVTYPGDVHFEPSASAGPYVQVVNPLTSATTLSIVPSPASCGAPATLTATVTPSDASGTVSFVDGLNPLGSATLSGGSAVLVVSTLTVGAHSMGGSYGGDAFHLGSTAPAVPLTVNKSNTTLVLTSDVNPLVWPSAVTFAATVTPAAASGTVTFKDSLTTIGSAPLIGGVATLVKSNLLPGLHTRIVAIYAGDACYKTATSPPYGQAVYRGSSSVSMATDFNPSSFGQNIKLTATMVPAGTTGRVTFSDGPNPLGTAAVNALTGLATLNVSNLLAGAHSLSVTYPGDVHFEPSVSSAYSQLVNALPTTTSLSLSAATATCLQPVTLTATVTPIEASGTVSFVDGVNALGSAPVSGGIATLIVSSLSVATHTLGATYNGDGIFAISTATNRSIVISKSALTLALTSGPSPSLWAQPVTLTAVASNATASGTVTFKDSLTIIGSAPLVGGVATLVKSNFLPGNHTTLTATLPAGSCFLAATAPAAGQLVYRTPTTVSMTTDINPSAFGQTVKLTASVSPIGGTGRVTFFDGVNAMGTAAVSSLTGLATLNTSNLLPGSHALTVSYPGDPRFTASVSAGQVSQVVTTAGSSVALTSDVNPSVSGQQVTLTASVTPTDATGSVEYFDGTNSIGAVTLGAGGVATLAVTDLPVGSHSLTAVYSGNGVYAGSTSPAYAQDVNAALLQQGSAAYLKSTITGLATETIELGVRVSWTLSHRDVFSTIELQRGTSAEGPWSVVTAALREEGGVTGAEDVSGRSGETTFYRIIGTTATGQQAVFGPVSGTAGSPREFALSSSWPNPSRGTMSMQMSVATSAHVRVSVVDLQGREVSVLAEGQYAPGRYRIQWDGRGDRGPAPAGMYFIQYTTPGKTLVNRVTIAR